MFQLNFDIINRASVKMKFETKVHLRARVLSTCAYNPESSQVVESFLGGGALAAVCKLPVKINKRLFYVRAVSD